MTSSSGSSSGSEPWPGRWPNSYLFAGRPTGRNRCAPTRSRAGGARHEDRRRSRSNTSEHFAATKMLDAGESYRTVAHILGNSESTLRLHYDGRTDVGARRAIAALEL